METKLGSFTWNYLTELRKELVSLQTIRSQIFGFKITFVSTLLGLSLANIDKIPAIALIIPAISANFFDSLIHGYSFSIKRTGFYCKTHLEPILREEFEFPKERPLWEQFMFGPSAGRNSAFWGTVGITVLATVPALWGAITPYNPIISLPVVVLLIASLIYNIRQFQRSDIFYSSDKQHSTFINPKPCVAVIITKDNEILLAQRAIDPAKGKWDLIGGFINVDESAEDAAIRETKEETGLDVVVKKYLGSISDVYGETNISTLNFCYLVQVKRGSPKANSDVAGLKWFSINEIPGNMAFAHQARAIELFKQNKKS
jgi:ADP-ribose pyrophosphatase YjhB (NUDIX family)